MTQERIYSYFQRNPQLHVLFIFDKANIIMNDLQTVRGELNISIKYLMELGSTLNITLNTAWKEKRVVLLFPLGTYPISEEQQLDSLLWTC